MLPSIEMLIDYINWLRQPRKSPSPLKPKDAMAVDNVIDGWLRLIDRAVKKGQLLELKGMCERVVRVAEGWEKLPTHKAAELLLHPVLQTKSKPALSFSRWLAETFTYHLADVDESVWKTMASMCKRCKRYFLKKGRQNYCSPKCRSAVHQRPYDPKKDRVRLRIYHQARRLGLDKYLSFDEIRKRLIEQYGKEVIDRYKIEGWKILWDEKANRSRSHREIHSKNSNV